VEIAVLLQALNSELQTTDHPLMKDYNISQSATLSLPNYMTQVDDELHKYIKRIMKSFEERTLVIFRPAKSNFRTLAGILVYKTPTTVLKIHAYQVKPNKKGASRKPLPPWIDTAFLIRGNASKKNCNHRTKPVKWEYMTREDIEVLLGFSIKPLLDVFSPKTEPQMKKGESLVSSSHKEVPEFQDKVAENRRQ
jgi:hypothetical protein